MLLYDIKGTRLTGVGLQSHTGYQLGMVLSKETQPICLTCMAWVNVN